MARRRVAYLICALTLGGCGGGGGVSDGGAVDAAMPRDMAQPACTVDADCAHNPSGPVCRNGMCATQCDAKNACPMGKVCDPKAFVCVGCVADKDCASPTPRCEAQSQTCVGCVGDGDCGAGMVCVNKACTMGCTGAHPACPMGQVCNLAAGACVGCLADGDCKTQMLPRCDAKANQCVACLPAQDNCGAGQYCSVNACVMGCKDNADCKGGQQCNTGTHQCVACVDDAACGFGQVCLNNACVAGCTPQHACPGGLGCCNNGCVKLASDNNNCGACGNVCGMGSACCGGVCISLQTVSNCGACGAACGPNQGCCGGACVTLNDPNNCGACGNVCKMGNGCCGGICVSIQTPSNCGACGASCGPNQDCCGGACASIASVMNCGACGQVCGAVANGAPACAQGQCAVGSCKGVFRDCNGSYNDGCEVDSSADAKNCGGCGKACALANATAGCANSACTVAGCAMGYGDCDKNPANGCEINLNIDNSNCGACGAACKAGVCVNGQCTTPLSCADLHNLRGDLPSGSYTIDADGQGQMMPFQVYCDNDTEKGGWTLVAGLVPTDGNVVDWNDSNYWTVQSEYGSFANHFINDYRSPASWSVSGTAILIEVAKGTQQADVFGYRAWTMNSQTFLSMFAQGRNYTVTSGTLATSINNVYAWEPLLRFGTNLIANRVDNPNGDATRLGITNRPFTGDDSQPGLGTQMNLDCCGQSYRHGEVELQKNSNGNLWCSPSAGDGTYTWLGIDCLCGGSCGGCQQATSPGYTPAWNYRIYVR